MSIKKNPTIFIIVALSFISFASATICNSNFVSLNYTVSTIPSGEIVLTSCTSQNQSNISLSGLGVPDYITKGAEQNVIYGTKEIKIKLQENIPVGIYATSLTFSDGSPPITALVTISPVTVQQGEILVFPTSNTITVQQGTSKTKNIQITVPSNYPRTITIQGLNFDPDVEVIKFDDLSLGQISPGQTVNIPIIYDGNNAQVGTYSTGLKIFATDSQGAIYFPTVNLQLLISAGITPADQTTFQNRPVCSLSSSTLNLNQTYTFSCTGVSNNVEVNPLFSDYFEGISADWSSNIYQYSFKPIKFGVTDFKAIFSYKGSPIFSSYNQEVRIQATSSQMGGTTLSFSFIPSLSIAKNKEEILIQIVDNSSKSLVDNPELYIDGLLLENKTGKSFRTFFETGKNYSLRAVAPGYNDLTEIFSLQQKPIPLTITPEKGDSQTTFNISSGVNATLYINGIKYTDLYVGILNAGTNKIEAYKEGYMDSVLNFTVDSALSGFSSGEFRKGVKQLITLNRNTTWTAYYQKDSTSPKEKIATGFGTLVEITPNKSGIYTLESDSRILWNGTIQGFDWNASWWFMPWYYWIGGASLIVILLIYKSKGNGGGYSPSFAPGGY